jgi:hypothetical protein
VVELTSSLVVLFPQQTALVLRKSGLGDKLAKLAAFEQQRAEGKSDAKLAAVAGMDQESLAAAFKAFYGSVASPDNAQCCR